MKLELSIDTSARKFECTKNGEIQDFDELSIYRYRRLKDYDKPEDGYESVVGVSMGKNYGDEISSEYQQIGLRFVENDATKSIEEVSLAEIQADFESSYKKEKASPEEYGEILAKLFNRG